MQPTGPPDFPGVVAVTDIAGPGRGEDHRRLHMHHELAGLALEGNFLLADDAFTLPGDVAIGHVGGKQPACQARGGRQTGTRQCRRAGQESPSFHHPPPPARMCHPGTCRDPGSYRQVTCVGPDNKGNLARDASPLWTLESAGRSESTPCSRSEITTASS